MRGRQLPVLVTWCLYPARQLRYGSKCLQWSRRFSLSNVRTNLLYITNECGLLHPNVYGTRYEPNAYKQILIGDLNFGYVVKRWNMVCEELAKPGYFYLQSVL